MENRIYASYSPTNYTVSGAPSTSPTRFYNPDTMFLAHYRRTAEAAAAAAAIDIAPPGVSSRISSSSTANFLSHSNPWASAFTAANVSSASLGLKRSSDVLYHPTILSTIGQNEAWYTTNSLAKRPRYETGSTLSIYPHRPGERDCAHYMLTRTCKFGESCKFDHPIWVPDGGIPDWKEGVSDI